MENGAVSWTPVHCLLPPFHPLAANSCVSSLKASVTEHLGGRPLPPPGLSVALKKLGKGNLAQVRERNGKKNRKEKKGKKNRGIDRE